MMTRAEAAAQLGRRRIRSGCFIRVPLHLLHRPQALSLSLFLSLFLSFSLLLVQRQVQVEGVRGGSEVEGSPIGSAL